MCRCFCEPNIAAIGDNVVKDLPHHQNQELYTVPSVL